MCSEHLVVKIHKKSGLNKWFAHDRTSYSYSAF